MVTHLLFSAEKVFAVRDILSAKKANKKFTKKRLVTPLELKLVPMQGLRPKDTFTKRRVGKGAVCIFVCRNFQVLNDLNSLKQSLIRSV